MLNLLHFFAKKRGILTPQAKDVTDFIEIIKEKGFIPILFIDDLQVMYPKNKFHSIDEENLKFRKDFISNISQLSSEGKTLIICAGSSMTLVEKALRNRSDGSIISQYIPLNDKKMKPTYLLPILDEKDFINSFKPLSINDKNIKEFYFKTGGIIREMVDNNNTHLSQSILREPFLIKILIYYYEHVKNTVINNPFDRIALNEQNLIVIASKGEEHFSKEDFIMDLNIWRDKGYLFCNETSYFYSLPAHLLQLYQRENEGLSMDLSLRI